MKPAKLAWLIAKWMVVPILCGIAGYYVIAPRFGVISEPPAQKEPAVIVEETPPAPSQNFKEPEVEVAVRKPARSTEFRKKPRKKKPEDAPMAPPETQTAPAPTGTEG